MAHFRTDLDLTLPTTVVGVTYKNSESGSSRQDNIASIIDEAFKVCRLRREFDNPYDKNAVAVFICDKKIGYLNRQLASVLAPKIDSGIIFHTHILKIKGGGDLYYGVEIKITRENNHEDIFLNRHHSDNNYLFNYIDGC